MFVVLMLSVFNHYTAKMTAAMVTSWVTFHMYILGQQQILCLLRYSLGFCY